MKRLLAIAVTLTSFATSEVAAQPDKDAAAQTANVNLTLISGPTLTKVADMTLPNSVVGVTSISVNPITGGSAAAYFILSAQASTPVTVTFSVTPLVLASQNPIPFAGVLVGNATDVQTSATNITPSSTVTTNSSGEYYFWAGGTATPAHDQGAGAYLGTFSLDVSY
jgi:hypothetical protein